MEYDEVKSGDGVVDAPGRVIEQEEVVRDELFHEVIEKIKMEAEQNSIEFHKRYNERVEVLEKTIAQLFAMGRADREYTEQLERSVNARLEELELRTRHHSNVFREHGQEIQGLTDRCVVLTKHFKSLETRVTTIELHAPEHVEMEEVVFDDRVEDVLNEPDSVSDENKLDRTIVPDNDEHVTRRSSRHVRSSVGTNAPGTVLDETALRGEISHSAEKAVSGTGRKVRIRSGDYDPGGDDSDSSHSKARKGKPERKGRRDKKKRDQRRSKDSDSSDSCSSSSSYSSPSSSSDESSVSSDSDSDSTSSAKGKRKTGTTAAYIGSLKKKYELSSPRAALAKYGTPGNIRAEEAKIFGNAGRINLQAKPTLEDLSLKKIEIPDLLIFRERFIQLQHRYDQELLITHHLKSRALASVTNTIQREKVFRKFKKRIRRFDGVLQMDQQLLSNDEVFSVLKYIARPQSKLDMDKWLAQSVWDPDSYELFKRKEYISSHMDDYVQAWSLYEVRFNSLIKMLGYKDAKKYLPVYIMKKGPHKGLVDYYLNGTPNPTFSYALLNAYIRADKQSKIKEFPDFQRSYFDVLQRLRAETKRLEDTSALFQVEKKPSFTPPSERKPLFKKSTGTKRESRVHTVDQGSRLMFDEDNEGNDSVPRVTSSHDEDQGSTQDEGSEEDVAESEPTTVSSKGEIKTSEETNDSWLATISFGPGRPYVCFDYAYTNRCPREEKGIKCQFSHDPEDIRKWKALKELGEDGAKSLVKSFGSNKSSGSSSYNKTHSHPSPTPPSQGARPQGQRPGIGRRS